MEIAGKKLDLSSLFCRRLIGHCGALKEGPSDSVLRQFIRASPLRVPVLLSVGKAPDSVKTSCRWFLGAKQHPRATVLDGFLWTEKNRSAENFGSLHRRHPRKCCSREERGSEVGSQCQSNIANVDGGERHGRLWEGDSSAMRLPRKGVSEPVCT